jgi:hypothetical protein
MLKALNGGAEDFPGGQDRVLSPAELGDLRPFDVGGAAAISGIGNVAGLESSYRRAGQRRRDNDSPVLGYLTLKHLWHSRDYWPSDQVPIVLS